MSKTPTDKLYEELQKERYEAVLKELGEKPKDVEEMWILLKVYLKLKQIDKADLLLWEWQGHLQGTYEWAKWAYHYALIAKHNKEYDIAKNSLDQAKKFLTDSEDDKELLNLVEQELRVY